MARRTKTGTASAKKVTTPSPAPSPLTPFNQLPRAYRRMAVNRLVGALRKGGFFSRGGYKTVWGPDQVNRRWTMAETGDELSALTASERNRLVSLARNTARNSEHMEGILNQLANNVIGVNGGKAIFTFPAGYEAAAERIHRSFAGWCQEAEYFDDAPLQELLRWVLRAYYVGGDMCMVYDWRVTSGDTGQIIMFEADCIGDVAEEEFAAAFPGCSQHQGIIKDRNGKTVGCVCSWSQRGQSEYRLFNEDGSRAAWTLIKPAGLRWADCQFAMLRNFTRPNQMRGASPLWSGLATIADGADLQGYEVQASKRNAQIIGQVLQAETQTGEAELASELDPDATAPLPVPDDGEGESEGDDPIEMEIEQQRLDLDDLTGKAGLIWDLMPPGVKAELFDCKHPNENLVEFSRWLHSGAAYAAGLTSLFATGKADSSYSAAMAEMILAQTQFRVEFQRLERNFLDWALANWSRRAQARGEIPQDFELPEDWRRTCVQWQHPQERALNPVDEQNAIGLGLKNLTRNYHETLGPDWQRKLLETAEELEFMRAHNIPDPRLQTVSGGVIQSNFDTSKENKQ